MRPHAEQRDRVENGSLLRPSQAATFLGVARSTVSVLVSREALPAIVLTIGPRGRRVLRFRRSEIEAWLEGRRARQLEGLLDGTRYARRRG